MKSNRGEVSVGKMIGAILAIILLFLLLGGTKAFGKTNNWLENLPGFGDSHTKQTDLEKIRYNLASETVQYYDGTNWQLFKEGKLELNDKVLSESDLKKTFNDFYFLTNTRGAKFVVYEDEKFALVPNSIKMNSGGTTGLIGIIWWEQYSRGAVVLNVWSKDSNGKLKDSLNTYYSLDYNKGLFLLDNSDATPFMDVSSSIPKIIQWRDSVFSKPLVVPYTEKGKTVNSKKFCAAAFDKTYLVVDLMKPTTEAKC